MFKKLLAFELIVVAVFAFGVESVDAQQHGRWFGTIDSASVKTGGISMEVNMHGDTWRAWYTNGTNVFVGLPLGAAGTYLKSNGAAAAPTFATPGGAPGGSDTEIQYNNGGAFDGVNFFYYDDTNLEIADDSVLAWGTDADWKVNYQETVANQLIWATTNTAATATTDPMFQILVGTTPTADQQVFGVAKGTQGSNTDLFTLDEDGDGTFAGTMEAATITEGGVAVHNNDEMDASSELAAIIDDETGTGNIVFSDSPTFTTTITFPADVVGDADINWGAGAGQVDAGDLPDFGTLTATSGNILVSDGTDFEGVAMSGDITIAAGGATAIGDDKVTEADLKVTGGAAVDEDILTYETTTGDFEWHTPGELGLQAATSKPLPLLGFAVSAGTDDAIDVYIPKSEPKYLWYCNSSNSSGSDNLVDTVTLTYFCPADLDSVVFDVETSSTDTSVTGVRVIFQSLDEFGDATPTSLYNRDSDASSVVDTWKNVVLHGDSLSAVSAGEWLRVDVVTRADDGGYGNWSLIRPYATY